MGVGLRESEREKMFGRRQVLIEYLWSGEVVFFLLIFLLEKAGGVRKGKICGRR